MSEEKINLFEVITIDGSRFRYHGEMTWQYALKECEIDILDKTIVEVIDHDGNVLKTYTQVIAVGDVDDNTCMVMPREKRSTACPRCGFCD